MQAYCISKGRPCWLSQRTKVCVNFHQQTSPSSNTNSNPEGWWKSNSCLSALLMEMPVLKGPPYRSDHLFQVSRVPSVTKLLDNWEKSISQLEPGISRSYLEKEKTGVMSREEKLSSQGPRQATSKPEDDENPSFIPSSFIPSHPSAFLSS